MPIRANFAKAEDAKLNRPKIARTLPQDLRAVRAAELPVDRVKKIIDRRALVGPLFI